jgi:ribosomal protein S18 acetylase RimI-like enzyme
MREAFFLDDAEWQHAVCARATEVIVSALDGLAGTAPAPTRIRPARLDDAPSLVGFAVAMALETEGHALPRATVEAGVARLLADPELGRVYVAEEDGEVVATLMLTREWSDWRDGWFWWIQSVYVIPARRRQGLYRRLYEHVAALAAANPTVRGLRLYVERENARARGTYVALGMRETGYRILEALTSEP